MYIFLSVQNEDEVWIRENEDEARERERERDRQTDRGSIHQQKSFVSDAVIT